MTSTKPKPGWAAYIESNANARLGGFKRRELADLVRRAGAPFVTTADAIQWRKHPGTAPEWLKAEIQRRANQAARRAVQAQQELAAAKRALIAALQAAPAYDTRSEEFAFLSLDAAMVSLMGRYSEAVLDAAARDLYPEAAEKLMGLD